MFCEIVEKEFPLGYLPEIGHFMVVEANHESCDEIEFTSEIRERSESFNSLDYTADTEQARHFSEHREAVDIKSNSRMTQQLCCVEEITRAAAKIENVLRARQIEFDLANPADINFDPTVDIEIFWPVCAWVFDDVSLTNLLETGWIDCFDDTLRVQRRPARSQQPQCVPSRAGQASAIYKLSYFMAKSHLRIDHTL